MKIRNILAAIGALTLLATLGGCICFDHDGGHGGGHRGGHHGGGHHGH